MAGLEPEGHRVLPACPGGAAPAARAARGVRRHAAGRGGGGGRPARGCAARLRCGSGDAGGQVARPARRARPAHDARGEPRDGPRHGLAPARRGAAGLPRRRALLRRLPRQPRLRAGGAAHRVRRGRRGRGALRHQRWHAAGLGRGRGQRRRGDDRRAGRHPLPQRHGLRGRQHALGGRRRRDPRAGHAQRVRRAHRQRRPGQRGGQPGAQARSPGAPRGPAARGDPRGARGRGRDQLPARLAPAVRRHLRVRAQGRAARQCDQGRPEPLPAHGSRGRRQRHEAARLRHGRPCVDRAEGPRARLRARPRPGQARHRVASRSRSRAGSPSRRPTPPSS